jgi:hypothetical protein
MSFHSIRFDQTSNTMLANLAGRLVTCLFRPLSGGAIPPGSYKLSAPMQNSVYGPFVLLSSASRPTVTGQGGNNKIWIDIQPRAATRRATATWIEPRLGWIEPRAGSLGSSKDWISSSGWIESPATYVNEQGLFVLVGKPLAGRNTIEITGGFAEFISALAQTGGSEVTIS